MSILQPSAITFRRSPLTGCEPVPEPIWILLKQESLSGSGISWAICKSAPHPRQITTPAQARFSSCRPNNSIKALKATYHNLGFIHIYCNASILHVILSHIKPLNEIIFSFSYHNQVISTQLPW